MMKKDIKRILVLGTIFIIVLFVLWTIGYTFLSWRMEQSQRQFYINESRDFISSDESFISQYGEILSFETQDKKLLKEESEGKTKYYMTFECETTKTQLTVRVYHVYEDAWSMYYVIEN